MHANAHHGVMTRRIAGARRLITGLCAPGVYDRHKGCTGTVSCRAALRFDGSVEPGHLCASFTPGVAGHRACQCACHATKTPASHTAPADHTRSLEVPVPG